MTDYNILKTERFGSRESAPDKIITCQSCGQSYPESYGECYTDSCGNRFCSEECAKEYYGIREVG